MAVPFVRQGAAEERLEQWQPTSSGGEIQPTADPADRGLSIMLGIVSLALGAAGVAIPGQLARLIGLDDDNETQTVLRAVGLREIASGIGILRQQPKPAGWVWARVAGDAMDLSLLGAAKPRRKQDRERNRITSIVLLGITLVDVFSAIRMSRDTIKDVAEPQFIRVKKSITVNLPADVVYNFWHNFENLPRFMSHLESVNVMGMRRSHWKAKAPVGRTVEWDAEVTEDVPNTLIAWRSLEGADIPNTGIVEFKPAPGGRGTEIHVELYYESPAGKIGVTLAKMFGEEPQIQVADDLRAFKQVMETGAIVRTDGTEMGKRGYHRPAQPRPKTDQKESN